MTSTKYIDEELNYFRVCKVTTHIMTDGLRTVFKQEWDNQYKATHGQWQDTAKNGSDFDGMESPKSKKRNARLLALMKNGNTKEWDCTCLFHAILYSGSIGLTLNPRVKKSVDELREFRNDVFAHTTDGELTVAEFEAAINKAITAFADLKLDTTDIEEIKNQTSFPTDELEDIKKKLEKEKKRNEEPPPFCVLPPKPSHEAVYRPNEVEKVNQEMERLENTKKNEVTVLYLSGNPGCGKSEVARQVGERFFDKGKEMSFVMTLNASTIDTLLQSYVEFAGRVGCDEDFVTSTKTSEGHSAEEKLNDLKCHITPRLQNYPSWLIIADNVSDLKSVSKYWHQAGEKTSGVGQILVTTQDSSSIPTDSYTYHLSLKQGMNLDDAISTLSQVSGSSAEESILIEVVKALDFQPLALACAAVYMQRIQSTDWTKYLEKLKEGKREATETVYKKTSSTYPATMTEAVRMAVEKEVNEDEVMRCAFQFLSVIAAEPISLDYIVQYVLSRLPNKDEELVASTVCSSSLVLSSEESEPTEVAVHQVVHSCLQKIILNEERRKGDVGVIWNGILAFSDIKSFGELENIPDVAASRKLLEHFTILSSTIQSFMELVVAELHISLNQKHVDVSNCLYHMQKICHTHGRFEAADILFRVSRMIVENLCDDMDPPGLAVLLNDIGNNLYYLGNYEEAIKYLTRALAIEENYGEHHYTIIATLNNLGRTLCQLRRYDEAMEYIERSLSIQERIYGEEHALWSKTINMQGYIFLTMGQLERAKTCFEKCLAIEEIQHGRNRHVELNVTLTNMGYLLRKLGQLEESKRCLERAIEITESLYDEKHPALENSLRHLGQTFSDLGQFDNARRNFQRALDIGSRKYGEDKHPSQAWTLSGIGECLRCLGKYEESKSYLKRALDIMEKVYRDDERHPSLLKTMNNLACTLIGLNQFKEANILLKKVLERQEYLFEEKNPEFAIKLYNNLAATLEQMDQDQESKVYLDKALAVVQESKYGSDLPPETLALTFHNLGEHKRTFGRYIEAEEYHKKAIDIKEKICPSHPDLALMLETMGETLSSSGKYDEARGYLERALKIQESVYDKFHPEIAMTVRQLGTNHMHQKKFVEATPYLESTLCMEESIYGKHHPQFARALHNLGAAYFLQNEYEQAVAQFERAFAIESSSLEESHPLMNQTIYQLGISYFQLKRYKEAKMCLEKALTMDINVHGERSALKAADIQDKLSIIREEQKQEKKQKREQRRQQKQERQDKHKRKYVNKRKL